MSFLKICVLVISTRLTLALAANAQLQSCNWYTTTTAFDGIAAEKISGNALRDLVVSSSLGSSCWYNNAQLFTQAFTLPYTGLDIEFGQLRQGTANKDLAITTAYGSLSTFLNNNNGSLTWQQTITTNPFNNISWGKVYLNAFDDLVGSGLNVNDNYVYIYHNLGTGFLDPNPVQLDVGDYSTKIKLVNLQLITVPYFQDLVVMRSTTIQIYGNNHNGSFFRSPIQTININSIVNNFTDFACGDVNQDGYNDLVAVSADIPNFIRVYLNRGDGTFDDVNYISVTPLETPQRITLMDADYDGYPDLVVASSWILWVLQNRNYGNFDSTLAWLSMPASMATPKLITATLTTTGATSVYGSWI